MINQVYFLVENPRQKINMLPRFLTLIYSSMKKIALLSMFAVIFFAGCAQQTPIKNLDTFAQCLTTKWATMYGSATCSHCLNQKAMFGKSFQYVTYVECTKEPARCANLKWVPTWEISSGTYLEGEQQLSDLAKATNCPLQ